MQRVLRQVLLQRREVVGQGHVVLVFGEGSRFFLNLLPLSMTFPLGMTFPPVLEFLPERTLPCPLEGSGLGGRGSRSRRWGQWSPRPWSRGF